MSEGFSAFARVSGCDCIASALAIQNNINGINGDANGDGRGTNVHTLSDPAVTRLQEAYVRHVIDAVGDLDNVLYEISNESGVYSTE